MSDDDIVKLVSLLHDFAEQVVTTSPRTVEKIKILGLIIAVQTECYCSNWKYGIGSFSVIHEDVLSRLAERTTKLSEKL